VDSPALQRILQHLLATGFSDIAGARVFAMVPIAESLLNQVIKETMPRDLPVRNVSVRPEEGNILSVRLTPRAMLIPAITLKLFIERQPEIPTSPVLVMRLATMPGILGLAGAALPLERMLPPGVRMQGEVIMVDLHAMARQHGFDQFFQHLRQLRVTTDNGRVLLTVEAGVS
jgi:hypothetical protein